VEPLIVDVTRGETVECRHRVHAVAVRGGEVVYAAGDPGLVTFLRSSAKPIQALPLARAYEELPLDELAIACASHLALPEQVATAERLLERFGFTEDDLECGAAGRPPSRLRHNCSGKHAGMLAVCRAHGWPHEGYRLPDHPLQRLLRDEVANAAEVPSAELETGIDGCGVVTFAMPLERMANAFARIPALDGGERIVAAMRAHPTLIRGPGGRDTVLLENLEGWIVKGGAEGLLCAAGPDGTAIALKAEDGASRPLWPAVAACLGSLHIESNLPQGGARTVENSRGEQVGVVRLSG
jgi:L-asparaginase II